MASIIQIGKRWRALIRRKGHKPYCKTFVSQRDAEVWARRVESSIDGKKPTVDSDSLTVGDIISEYRRMRVELGSPVSPLSNTSYMLAHLDEDLGDVLVQDLLPARFIQWAKMRAEQGAGPHTVNMELSALGTVLRHTSGFLNVVLPDVVGAARPLLHYGQLIGGGTKRTRRPTDDELTRLLSALDALDQRIGDAVRVSSITGLRRGELARIEWAGLDELRKSVMVKQRKHPRMRLARDQWVPLLGDAWDIVQRQPKTDARIFPISPEKLTDSVTDSVRKLGIPDLHLHDMRRGANSTLREMGFDDDERQAVMGHSSKEMNSRYVAVSLESLHAKYVAAQDKPQRRQRRRKADAPPV